MPKKLDVNCSFEVFESIQELNINDLKLLQNARDAMKNAYAPYSQFFVGAAVLLENGIIVTGNNQENAAYPSGLCAERVAIFHASSQYPDQKMLAVAVSVSSNKKLIDKPVSPCGSCRQSLSEYEVKFNSPIRLIMSGVSGEIYISTSIANLLPLMFTAKNL